MLFRPLLLCSWFSYKFILMFLVSCPVLFSCPVYFRQSEKSLEKKIPLERASQREHNGANLSSVAPSREEL